MAVLHSISFNNLDFSCDVMLRDIYLICYSILCISLHEQVEPISNK